MATVITWHCRNQAAMACRSAVKVPKRRTLGGKTAGAPGTEACGDETAPGGTQTHRSVAPTSMPAACGLSVCSKATALGSGGDEGDLRRGMASSKIMRGHRAQRRRARVVSEGKGSGCGWAAAVHGPTDSERGRGGGRQSSQRDRRRPGAPGRVVTNDEAADSPIQTSKRARGTTARTDTATRCQA